jgi:citrate lyase subunit beta / citryl-CoA lyase
MNGAGIRSLLFVPGDKEALILKAFSSQSDAVIIDLEDAVAPENKIAARAVTRGVLDGAARNGKPVFVRLSAYDTGMTAADAAAVLGGKPWGVVLPKCQGAADLTRLSHQLEVLEAREGIAAGMTRILSVATETAASTLALSQSATCDRLWGLLWGGEDLAAALGVTRNRDEGGAYTFPFQFARSQCLYAANAVSAVAVDAVYTDFRDPEGLEREARAGLRDGFTAKAAIHPAQVDVINRVMTPDKEHLDWAQQVVEILADQAVARLDGRMVDLAHKRIAERLLARAAAISAGGA